MKIYYCVTDEAAMLAARSLLPIVGAFARRAGVEIVAADVSLAARVLAEFYPNAAEDALGALSELTASGGANIVKLPGISATRGQLEAAISELRGQGIAMPAYSDAPDPEQREARRRYDRVLGSAVNVALRRGNSERSIAGFVKAHARTGSHRNAAWRRESRSHVATMSSGDFRSTERAVTVTHAGRVRVEHVSAGGVATSLGTEMRVSPGDVLDCGVLRRAELAAFLRRELVAAQRDELLFSLELKCSVMRVSDPVILELAESLRSALGANAPALAHGEPRPRRDAVGRASIAASMAQAIRRGGVAFAPDGALRETKFVIPDHAYAGLYRVLFEHCAARGAFDPRTLGSASIVGLTAEAAEEYGSLDTTFELAAAGRVRLVDERGSVLSEHDVDTGDVWRLCRAARTAVEDWIHRGILRSQSTREPVVFWLDRARPRDHELAKMVERIQARMSSTSAAVSIRNVAEAAELTFSWLRSGKNVIAAVGNVLRDYLTELFCVLEIGTSAWAQATTSLPAGGTLFETGSAGCAPRQFQDFLDTNHLRWSSLGEITALVDSLGLVQRTTGNDDAGELARTLEGAARRLLSENRLPSRTIGELDTRGSHFYLALYWSLALADSPGLARKFAPLADRLLAERVRIDRELREVQGAPVSLGGYYHPSDELVEAAMRPSETFNRALAGT